MFLLSLGYRNLGQTVLVGGRPSNSHWLKMITHFKVIKKNANERLTLNRVFPQILWRNTAERRNLELKHDQLTDILCYNQNLFIHLFIAETQYSHISLFMRYFWIYLPYMKVFHGWFIINTKMEFYFTDTSCSSFCYNLH